MLITKNLLKGSTYFIKLLLYFKKIQVILFYKTRTYIIIYIYLCDKLYLKLKFNNIIKILKIHVIYLIFLFLNCAKIIEVGD